MKQLFDFICRSMQKALLLNQTPTCIEDELLQVAFSWTNNMQQAKLLTDTVLVEFVHAQGDGAGVQRVKLYSRMFEHWYSVSDARSNEHATVAVEKLSIELTPFHGCIYRLPVFQRVALTLVDIAGLSYRDVGRIIDIEESHINVCVTLARGLILQQLTLLSTTRIYS